MYSISFSAACLRNVNKRTSSRWGSHHESKRPIASWTGAVAVKKLWRLSQPRSLRDDHAVPLYELALDERPRDAACQVLYIFRKDSRTTALKLDAELRYPGMRETLRTLTTREKLIARENAIDAEATVAEMITEPEQDSIFGDDLNAKPVELKQKRSPKKTDQAEAASSQEGDDLDSMAEAVIDAVSKAYSAEQQNLRTQVPSAFDAEDPTTPPVPPHPTLESSFVEEDDVRSADINPALLDLPIDGVEETAAAVPESTAATEELSSGEEAKRQASELGQAALAPAAVSAEANLDEILNSLAVDAKGTEAARSAADKIFAMLLRGPGGMSEPDDIFAKAQQDFIPGVTPIEAVRVNLFPSDDSNAFPDASEEPEALPEPAKPVKAAKAKKTSRTSKTPKTAKAPKALKTAKSSRKTKSAAAAEEAPADEELKAVAAKPKRTRKKAAPAAAEAPEAALGEDAKPAVKAKAVTIKPAKKTVRSKKTTAVENAAAPEADPPSEPVVKKPRKRRTTAKKKTEE